jgi:hypothetical protein
MTGPVSKSRGHACAFKIACRARVLDFAFPLSSSSALASRSLHFFTHLQRDHPLRLQPARAFTTAMSNWTRSNVSREQLLHLVEAG